MTYLTIGRKLGSSMVWIGSIVIIGLMAAKTGGRDRIIIIPLMAGKAGYR